ncbi:cerebellin-2-like [Brachyhypopomus gauderio]|uniref:cerebellin-2-like n=1 Tax=Brachyhypopomus gauderio TaxID=698409 RepID=UPI0040418503
MPSINIIEELQKVKTLEVKMKSMEAAMENLKLSNIVLSEKLRNIKEDIKIENTEQAKVAFSATLKDTDFFIVMGPYKKDTTLVFENVLTNIGNAYNSKTGVFTAPVRGVYYFSFVTLCPQGMQKTSFVALWKNGAQVVSSSANFEVPRLLIDQSSGNSVSLLLEKGDRVYLKLLSDKIIYSDVYKRDSFSGHLLFTM